MDKLYDLVKLKKDREELDNVKDIYPLLEGTLVEDDNLGDGLVNRWIIPPASSNNYVVFYVHGGGFVQGSFFSHAGFISHIAKVLECEAYYVDYSLAPENPYPKGVEDILNSYERLCIQKKVSGKKIIFVGDSAGGNLIASVMLKIIQSNRQLPSASVLISPWIDLTCSSASWQRLKDEDPVLTDQEGLKEAVEMYITGFEKETSLTAKKPFISPVFADELLLSKFPPTLIQYGTKEIIFDDCAAFAEKIRVSGGKVIEKIYKDQVHVWPILNKLLEKEKWFKDDLTLEYANNQSQAFFKDLKKFIETI